MRSKIKKTKYTALLAAFALGAFSIAQNDIDAKEAKYGMAGCGPGSYDIVSKDREAQFLIAQNASSSTTVSSAISSATSNCDSDSASAYRKNEQENFVSVNYSSLKQEAAVGKGKNLEAFASLLGCPAESSFGGMTRKNHAYFFSVPKNEPAAFVSRIKAKMQIDSKLSAACKSQV